MSLLDNFWVVLVIKLAVAVVVIFAIGLVIMFAELRCRPTCRAASAPTSPAAAGAGPR